MLALITKHGYRNIKEFCLQNNITYQNFNTRLKDENINVDILTLFLYADLLHEPIMDIIEIYYPEQTLNNKLSCHIDSLQVVNEM